MCKPMMHMATTAFQNLWVIKVSTGCGPLHKHCGLTGGRTCGYWKFKSEKSYWAIRIHSCVLSGVLSVWGVLNLFELTLIFHNIQSLPIMIDVTSMVCEWANILMFLNHQRFSEPLRLQWGSEDSRSRTLQISSDNKGMDLILKKRYKQLPKVNMWGSKWQQEETEAEVKVNWNIW